MSGRERGQEEAQARSHFFPTLAIEGKKSESQKKTPSRRGWPSEQKKTKPQHHPRAPAKTSTFVVSFRLQKPLLLHLLIY